MRKLFYFLVSIVLLVGLQLSCTQEELPGGIYGTVVDKATGEPIRSAGVELSPGGMKTVTGSEGQFEFTELAPGNYTLIITKAGYSDFASSIIEVKSAQTTKTDVQIEKLPPSLRVVDDKKGDIEELDFGSSVDDVARSFNLFNDGTESLEWQITTTAEWIKSVSKTEGVLKAGETQSLIVIIDRILLKSGKNTTTVHITSNNGSKQLEIIATGPILTTLNTLAATNVKTTTATLNGEILADGSPKYSERGFVYSESSMPTLGSCIQKITSTLTESKTYSATVSGLTKGKTYYVRAYAINAGKEAYSTNEVSFTPSDALPQVSTQEVTNISRTAGKATFNGTIIDEGDPIYTERGFVYATTHNPMVDSDTKVVATGKGRGEFSANATNLQLGNVYYVRAYAINEKGVAYGEEMSFDFNAILPKVSTSVVSNVSRGEGSATFHGFITNLGDPSYIERGFVYSTTNNPELGTATKVVATGKGIGEFSTNATNLQLGNVYYVRAYAINEKGVAYGEEMSFDFNVILPKIATSAVSNITLSTALLNGNVLNQGDPSYTECGFVYGTMSNPTLVNGAIKVKNNMSGIGKMETQISGFEVATKYYVSCYAISTAEVVYGDVVNFITPIDVQGIVLNEEGEAIANANIVFSNSNTSLTSQTNQNGEFSIKGVFDSESYKIVVKAKGYADYTMSRSFSLTNKSITIFMQKLGSISGIIKDDAGFVLINHPVVCGGKLKTYTDNNGYYEFQDLIPGQYYISAELDGYFRSGSSDYVQVLSGRNSICNFTLEKNGSVNIMSELSFELRSPSLCGTIVRESIVIKNLREGPMAYSINNIPKGVSLSKANGIIPAKGSETITCNFTYPSNSNGASCVYGNWVIDGVMYTKTYVWNWSTVESTTGTPGFCSHSMNVSIECGTYLENQKIPMSFFQYVLWR